MAAKVREAMTEDVLTITPGRSLREAARFMVEHNVGALVIMDPEQPGPGIVTERDVVRSLGSGEDPDQEVVSDHLTSKATFADARVGPGGGGRRDGQRRVPPPGRRLQRRRRRHHLDARHHARVAAQALRT